MGDFTLEVGFKPSQFYIEKTAARKEANSKNTLSFGIHYLDQCLGGIQCNDLILITGRTGGGKTELVTRVALENAKIGKRVHYFALEAYEGEIEDRIRYQLLAYAYYNIYRKFGPKIRINFQDWITGKLEEEFRTIEPEVELEQIECMKNMWTRYRNLDFTLSDFKREFLAIQDQTDLVIIDHLHYFDTDDANENKALKEIVKGIRDAALLVGKPVLLVCHLRKSDKKAQQILPDIEDIHGTSDIGKIATKGIVIAPASDRASNSCSEWLTYIRAVKNRMDGSRTRFVGLVSFSTAQNRYLPGFKVGKLSIDGSEFLEVQGDEVPHWAKPISFEGRLL